LVATPNAVLFREIILIKYQKKHRFGLGQRDRYVVLPFLGNRNCFCLPAIGKWVYFQGKQMSFVGTGNRALITFKELIRLLWICTINLYETNDKRILFNCSL
jgi:hypothetical protein